jgi:endo-1,4-beta-D-glucanase Y
MGKKKKQTSHSKEEKVTNEKPVSLSPLGFKEALAALLKVKPKPKEEKTEEKKEEKTDN